jgi:hypothetical protein
MLADHVEVVEIFYWQPPTKIHAYFSDGDARQLTFLGS